MQKTMNIDGRKVTVRARRRHSRGNPIGWSVKIDAATYFFNVLDPRQAMDKAVAKHLADAGRDGAEQTMRPEPLTTLEAAEIGREMGVLGLLVCRDSIDRRLWRVATDQRAETHEPMDEAAWREFLAGWVERPRRRDAGGGRKATMTPTRDENERMQDALKDVLSPEAIAVMAEWLRSPIPYCDDDAVDRQVRWFQRRLVDLLGGSEQQARLAEELGL